MNSHRISRARRGAVTFPSDAVLQARVCGSEFFRRVCINRSRINRFWRLDNLKQLNRKAQSCVRRNNSTGSLRTVTQIRWYFQFDLMLSGDVGRFHHILVGQVLVACFGEFESMGVASSQAELAIFNKRKLSIRESYSYYLIETMIQPSRVTGDEGRRY